MGVTAVQKYPSRRFQMAQKRSILVVDDESGIRESIQMILQPKYEVYTAADGNEALQCIQKDKIDVVTLDLKMPGLSGIDVLKKIKQQNADIEVVVITGYGTPQNHQEAALHGAGDFITKPFDTSDLVNSISKSLERRAYNLRLKNFARYNSSVVVKE
jgi:putative two-component system response regulator